MDPMDLMDKMDNRRYNEKCVACNITDFVQKLCSMI